LAVAQTCEHLFGKVRADESGNDLFIVAFLASELLDLGAQRVL
jgi:hypothetical protein